MKGDIAMSAAAVEAARTAFYDYYLACREMDVNHSTTGLVTQFREMPEQVSGEPDDAARCAPGPMSSGYLESRRTEVTRDEQVAIARINTLLHRAADHPLPPHPPKCRFRFAAVCEALQQAAESRPICMPCKLASARSRQMWRWRGKEYYPDLNLLPSTTDSCRRNAAQVGNGT